MPELSEIHLFAHLINSKCADKVFIKVVHSKWDKHPPISVQWSEFKISAIARGKELQLTIRPAHEIAGSTPLTWLFNHGLVGKWDWILSSSIQSAPAGTQIMFNTATHSLIYNDTMKMGGWKQTSEWGKSRSPDPILEFFDFCNNVVSNLHKKNDMSPICDLLLDQNYFNGIGNYLRAEICYRAGIDPFARANVIFKETPKTINANTFNAIIADANSGKCTQDHDKGLLVLYLSRQIPLEVISQDMNKYGTADQKERFNAWLRIYDKGMPVKHNGRTVHCAPKQRLRMQEPDLGKHIDEYPFPLVNLYSKPTIRISNISSSNSASGTTSPSQNETSSNSSSNTAFSQTKRVEESVLPCRQIVDLDVPMATKLLMAITSLSRSGKILFLNEPNFRLAVLADHPVCYSAWQVFESNLDEDDFLDTLNRVSISVAQEGISKKTETISISHLSEITRNLSIAYSTSQSASQPPPSIIHDDYLPTRVTKKIHYSASESTSESSSTSGDYSHSETEELGYERPKKKKLQKPGSKAAKKINPFSIPLNQDVPKFPSFRSPPKAAAVVRDKIISYLTEKSWLNNLQTEINSKKFDQLCSFLEQAYRVGDPPVYPAKQDIFNAFNLCPLDKVKVVILGQDPYHGPGQAHGLCFSVLRPTPPPPSLVNVFKELETDVASFTQPKHGDLTAWAQQGVFLLNTVLTVYQQKPNSHQNKGWEEFTSAVIKLISDSRKGVVFMLWGKPSEKKATLIDSSIHHILKAPHPSPLSAFQGWFGCRHFSKANQLLQAQGDAPIDWTLPN